MLNAGLTGETFTQFITFLPSKGHAIKAELVVGLRFLLYVGFQFWKDFRGVKFAKPNKFDTELIFYEKKCRCRKDCNRFTLLLRSHEKIK